MDDLAHDEILTSTIDGTVGALNAQRPEDLKQNIEKLPPEQKHSKATHKDFLIRPNDHDKLSLFSNDGKLISAAIWVSGMARDADGNGWANVVDFYDQDNNLRRWLMPCALTIGPNKDFLKELISRGHWSSDAESARSELVRYLKRPKNKRFTTTLTSGWHNDGKVFVFPSGESVGDGSYLLQDARPSKAPTGTLKDWQDNVANLCVGNSRLTMSASIAFASPLLYSLGADSAGFHFVGGSSLGKSKAAHVAASVFGRDLQSWRVTDNGLEGIARRHSDVGLVMDDLGQSAAHQAGAISYMLGNGQGKARADQNGSDRKVQTWRLMYLSTGEISLSEHMGTVGGKAKAGQELRLLNIEADAGKGLGLFDCLHGISNAKQFADNLGDMARRYTGVAGPEFVRYLISQRIPVGAYVKDVQQQFAQAVGLSSDDDGQIQRAASHFVVAAAAGELATDAGITGWDNGEAIRGACKCFEAWRRAWSPTGSREAEQAIEQVRAFIQENESRFECKKYTPRDRAGYMKEDGSEFWIFPNVFKTEVCEGLRPSAVAKALADAGVLEVDSHGKRSIARRPEGGGKLQRFYVVNEGILFGGDHE